MNAPTLHSSVLATILLFCSSCSSMGVRGGDYRIYETASGEEIEFEQMISDLSAVDVVFLGEEHGNDAGHRLQLWTIRQLHQNRPELVISLEQFEADVQARLDAYLVGEISEEEFLTTSRPWGNYTEHYRPIIEYARREGIPVIAANIPRPLASRVAKEGGLYAVGHEEFAPWEVWTDEPEYAQLFAEAMGRTHIDENDKGLQRWFDAQCIKDSMMAKSIAGVWQDPSSSEQPLVVHLCGKFHSNYGLGTVSRLERRREGLDIKIVSMVSDETLRRPLTADERRTGDFIWIVEPAD